MPAYANWIIMGDFNYVRFSSDRNREGGNFIDMLHINEAINALALVEIPLKGRKYTWSNKQDQSLFEKLDRIFTSSNWTSKFLNALAIPLAKISSDHVPIKVQIDSHIPKCHIFRLEEFWIEFEGFIETVENHWLNNAHFGDSAKNIVSKFKSIKKGLKNWSKKL